MHQYIINASLQIVPLVQDKHPYEWVDEAIAVIQQSGIKHEIGPFATILEGTYEQIMNIIHQVQEHLRQKGCAEWITNLQIQLRCDRDITAAEKIEKYQFSNRAN